MVSVELPEPPDTDEGLKLALACGGKEPVLKATVPVNPPDGLTVTVYEVLDPALTFWLEGEALIVKSPVTGAVISSVTVFVCVRLPLVPVMVTVYVPVVVVLVVETFKVAVPAADGVTETEGGMLGVGPEGDTLALKLTVPLKLFSELAVTE